MMHSLLPSGQRLPQVLVILLVTLAFLFVSGGVFVLLFGHENAFTPASMADASFHSPMFLFALFLLLVLPAAMLCGVLFLIWGYRLCARLRGLNRSFPLTTDRPILLVLSFFAPVVRLWHPMQCFKRAALLQQDADRPCNGRTPPVIYYWGVSFALFILSPSIFLPILFKLLPCTTSGNLLYFVHEFFLQPGTIRLSLVAALVTQVVDKLNRSAGTVHLEQSCTGQRTAGAAIQGRNRVLPDASIGSNASQPISGRTNAHSVAQWKIGEGRLPTHSVSEAMLHDRLRRQARAMAGALCVLLLALLGTGGYWLWHALAKVAAGGDTSLMYVAALHTAPELLLRVAKLEQLDNLFRIGFCLALAGWIIFFVRYGYHLVAQARVQLPGAIAQHPSRCVLWLLVPVVNVWMTYLVLRAAHRVRVASATASAPLALFVLSGAQLLNWVYNLGYALLQPAPEVLDGVPQATIHEVAALLGLDLGRFALLLGSYLLFFVILGRVRENPAPAQNA